MKWVINQLISNPTIADALLGWLVHNSHKIDLNGESQRKGYIARQYWTAFKLLLWCLAIFLKPSLSLKLPLPACIYTRIPALFSVIRWSTAWFNSRLSTETNRCLRSPSLLHALLPNLCSGRLKGVVDGSDRLSLTL